VPSEALKWKPTQQAGLTKNETEHLPVKNALPKMMDVGERLHSRVDTAGERACILEDRSQEVPGNDRHTDKERYCGRDMGIKT
jgi:hypothetical protein